MSQPPSGISSDGGDAGSKMTAERYESFVIRVLVGTDGGIERGQVTHVATGQRLHFTEPERLPDLIRRMAMGGSARNGRDIW